MKVVIISTMLIIILSVLTKPSLELKMKRIMPCSSGLVAALPAGEVLICRIAVEQKSRRSLIRRWVSKISNQGLKGLDIYNCTGCYITGLLVLGEDIFIIHSNGTVLQFSLGNWKLLRIYQINNMGGRFLHTGSLSSDPSMIPDQDQLLLADSSSYEVFTYRLSTRKKIIRKKSPRLGPPFYGYPRTVSYGFYNNTVFFIVSLCYGGNLGNKIIIYDSEWNHVRSFGGNGTRDGQFIGPHGAIVSSDNTIIVADYHNNRLSEFTMEGQFVRQILDRSDGITKPAALSFWFPHLWVIHSGDSLYRYKYE